MILYVALLAAVDALIDTEMHNAAHIKETQVLAIDNKHDLDAHADAEDAEFVDGWLNMGGEDNTGGLLRLKESPSTVEWAVELHVKIPEMARLQHAGLFFWYTEKPVIKGNFLGGLAKFNGLAAGIHFGFQETRLAFSFNYGLDYTGNMEDMVHREQVDPAILSSVKELTIKVIHTAKNFAVELYHQEKLILDTFRINDKLNTTFEKPGPFFGVSTFYEGSPAIKPLQVKHIMVYDRKEGSEYRVGHTHTPFNKHKHDSSDKEVQHAIADLKHFMAYVANAFHTGEINGFDHIKTVMKERVHSLRARVDTIVSQVRKVQEVDKLLVGGDNSNTPRLERLEQDLKGLHIKLEQLKGSIDLPSNDRKTDSLRPIANMLVVFTVLVVLILIVKQILSRTILHIPIEKKKG